MPQILKTSIGKISVLLALIGFVALLSISTNGKFNNSSTQKPVVSQEKTATESPKPTNADGSSNVSVNVSNSTQTNQNSTSNQSGTCTVTKNGVTTVVPADQVSVNEKTSSGGSIDVKVDCSTNVNSSNKTSINNSVNVNASAGN